MSTVTIIERNRANAARSTGPRTIEGKDRSAGNATRHGIFAKALVLGDSGAGETLAAFRALHARLVEDLQPVGALEEMTVERIAVLHWRLRRLYRAEAGETLAAGYQAAWRDFDVETKKMIETKRFGTLLQGVDGIVHSPYSLGVALDVLDDAEKEVEENGTVGEEVLRRAARIWGAKEDDLAYVLALFSHIATAEEAPPVAEPVSPEQCRVALLFCIETERKRLSQLRDVGEDRLRERTYAAELSAAIPSAPALAKLSRYEAHLERLLARAVDQLIRLQRARRGEPDPPTLRLETEI
jgi:hypothetical protein